MQILVMVVFDVMTSTDCPHGFALLKTIRKYVELDVYVGFDLHTEGTLAAFEECLIEFQGLLDVGVLIFLFDNSDFFPPRNTLLFQVLTQKQRKNLGSLPRFTHTSICPRMSATKVAREVFWHASQMVPNSE